MPSPRNTPEVGPWRGLYSAADLGDIPPGGSSDRENIVNVPGNPAAYQPRGGVYSFVNEDRLPAYFAAYDANPADGTTPNVWKRWVTSGGYTVGNRVVVDNVGYECVVDHTSGTFATDLANRLWLDITDQDPPVTTAANMRNNDYIYGYERTYRLTQDITAATGWTTGLAYVTDDIVLFRANDPRAGENQGGVLWKAVSNHTAAADFFTDLNAGLWTPVVTEQDSSGIIVSPAVLDPRIEEGPIIQVQATRAAATESDGVNRTTLLGSLAPRVLYTQQPGFVSEPSTPIPPGLLPEAPNWAYFGNWSEASGVCNIARVDINPFSKRVGTASSTDLTAGKTHRPWIVKGLDNRAYFLFWRSVNGQSTGNGSSDNATSTWFGHWDGVTLDENEFNPTFDIKVEGVTHRNNFDSDDVPRWMAISASGTMFLGGRATPGSIRGVRPTPPPVAVDEEGNELRQDVAWTLQGDGLPDDLFVSNGVISTFAAFSSQNRNAYPHLLALSNGDFLLSSTDGDSGNTGIRVRRITWNGQFPVFAEGTEQIFTTSDEPSQGDGENESRNAFNGGNKVCLANNSTFAVARGTNGWSFAPINGGNATTVSDDITDVVGVCGDTRSNRVYVADDVGSSVTIRQYGIGGAPSGVPWTTSEYAALAGEFRGMFMDRRQLFLCVMTYDSAQSAGSRNRLTCIPVNISAWATSTAYEVGDLVVESNNVYQCIQDHTSGTFATDRTNNKWGANGDATDALTISHTLVQGTVGFPSENEAQLWAFLDSAGGQLYNMGGGLSA